VSQKQVICTFETMDLLKVVGDSEFPLVARLDHREGGHEDVRHDGTSFYRPICAVGNGRTAFPKWMLANNYLRRTYLKLMEDEQRRSLEYSELTWPPTKTRGGKRERPEVPFSEVEAFELLDPVDVARCEAEVSRLAEALLVHDNRIWIKCGEPCYRLSENKSLQLETTLTFSDQDERRKIDEMHISATDPERVRTEWGVIADKDDRIRGFSPGVISVFAPELFVTDFDDIGFAKYATTAARSIAYYLSQRAWHDESETLMATELDDIDLWNALRRTIGAMNEMGSAAAGDDELVLRAVGLWKRLGGASYAGSRHLPGDVIDKWFGSTVRNWMDRKIELDDIVSNRRANGVTP
jgi:hypothetical protein